LSPTSSSSSVTQLVSQILFLPVSKARHSYIVHLTAKPDQPRFTIIKVAVDLQEPMVLQC